MKNRIFVPTILVIAAMVILNSCASIPKKAKPVTNFEVNRYLGAWYEIARFDFHFEKDLDNTTAQYMLLPHPLIERRKNSYSAIKAWLILLTARSSTRYFD